MGVSGPGASELCGACREFHGICGVRRARDEGGGLMGCRA